MCTVCSVGAVCTVSTVCFVDTVCSVCTVSTVCSVCTVCSVGTVCTICGQVFSNCHCSQFLVKAFFFICGLFAICSAVMLPRFFYHSLYSVC